MIVDVVFPLAGLLFGFVCVSGACVLRPAEARGVVASAAVALRRPLAVGSEICRARLSQCHGRGG